MTKSHKHGLLFRFRVWLGVFILPPRARQTLFDALVKDMAAHLGEASLSGDIAGEDQARAALKDLGFSVEVFTDSDGGESA